MDPFRDWKTWATRGFYAYDWSDVNRPVGARLHRYELIAAPTDPIASDAMPEALRLQPRLGHVRFEATPFLDITITAP